MGTWVRGCYRVRVHGCIGERYKAKEFFFYEGTKKIAVGGGMVFKMAAWITANAMMVNAVRLMSNVGARDANCGMSWLTWYV